MASQLPGLKPKGYGQRHIMAITSFIGFTVAFSLRFNLSIAIVAMVKHNHGNVSISQQLINQSHLINPKSDDVCPHPDAMPSQQILMSNLTSLEEDLGNLESSSSQSNWTDLRNININHGELDEDDSGEFNWSEVEQGILLGSFFWGYIVTQVLGGWLGQRFGGKWPAGVGILIAGLLAALTPFAAQYGGLECLIVLRIFQGFAQGIAIPSLIALLAKWAPPDERGKIVAFVFSGMPCGTALSTIISGYIIYYLGWPSVFYIGGIATVLWFVIWSYLIYSGPDEHPRISQEELIYIQTSIHGTSKSKKKSFTDIPWKKIWTSGPVWATLICHTSGSWGAFFLMTEIPTYMKTVLHFDIKQNSIMTAFPHLLTLVVSILVTQLGDFAISNRYLSTVFVRKSCNTLGSWGTAAALLGVAYSGCDVTITVALLAFAIAIRGGVYGGVMVNIIDIVPNYAGVLMGISNIFSGMTGFLAPWITGLIINNNPSIQQWRLVFLLTCAIYFVGNLIFLILGSGEEESWNRSDDDQIENGKNVEIPPYHDEQIYANNGTLTLMATTTTTIVTTPNKTNGDEGGSDIADLTSVTMARERS